MAGSAPRRRRRVVAGNLEQIRGCDVFVFALSQNSIQSKPCQAELHYAQGLGLPILPVQVGPVDSTQLNPLATVQTVDYRNPAGSTGMRLLAALHRARAQRQPLPSPLPEEPAVPFEYLIRLYTTIAGPDQLSPRDQVALVAQLELGLREDGDHDAARKDIVTLLTKLRDREDVTYRTRTDVDTILANMDPQAHLESGPPQPVLTASTPDVSTNTPTPQDPGSSPKATTNLDRLAETPPIKRTAEINKAVPLQRRHSQPETTQTQQKTASPSKRRRTKIIVGITITLILILLGAGLPMEMVGKAVRASQVHWEGGYSVNSPPYPPYFYVGITCLGIAGLIIIASLVVAAVELIRLSVASAKIVNQSPALLQKGLVGVGERANSWSAGTDPATTGLEKTRESDKAPSTDEHDDLPK